MKTIAQKKDFLSSDECDLLILLAECQSDWDSYPGSFLDGRIIDFFTTLQHRRCSSIQAHRLCLQIYRKMQEYVSKFVGHDVYIEFMAILRIEPGAQQPMFKYVASELGRVAESVVFLNEDFDGGKALYPDFEKIITPKTGSIYVAKTENEHSHGVSPVSGSTRYSIISGWTNKPLTGELDERLKKLEDYVIEFGQEEAPIVG